MTYETVVVIIAFSNIFLAPSGTSKYCTNEYIKNPVATIISKKANALIKNTVTILQEIPLYGTQSTLSHVTSNDSSGALGTKSGFCSVQVPQKL